MPKKQPEIPQDQLQQIIQLLQEQQIDLENVDPNLLEQLLQAQQAPAPAPPKKRLSRPSTAKAAPKKPKKNLQAYQHQLQFK